MKKEKILRLVIAGFLGMLSLWTVAMIELADTEKTYTLYSGADTENITIQGILADGVSMDLKTFADLGMYDEERKCLSVSQQNSLELKAGCGDRIDIHFAETAGKGAVKWKDHDKNVTTTYFLADLQNEAGECILTYNVDNSTKMHAFLKTLTIRKFFVCFGIYILFGLFDFYALGQIQKLLDKNAGSYSLWEIAKTGILFFLLMLAVIYSVLDVVPTTVIFVLEGIFLALLLYRLYGALIQNAYAVLALYIGISMLFILPMFRVPDEFCHFTNVYAKSLLPDEMLGGTKGEELALFDEDLEETFLSFQGGYGGDFQNGKCYARKFYHDMTRNVNSGTAGTIYHWYANCANLSIFPYIPAILTTMVLRHASIPPIILLLAVRFVNFLLTVLLGYLSIKRIPIWKKYVFIVLMLPISLQQGFGIAQDSLNNALFIFAFSLLVASANRYDSMTVKESILIFGTLVGLSSCKLGYAPIALFIILLPDERFSSRQKSLLYKISMIACIVFINIVYYMQMMPSEEVTAWYNRNSVGDVLADPFGTLMIYVKTFIGRFEGDFFTGLLNGMGISFWTITGMTEIVSLVILILLLFVSGWEERYYGNIQRYLVLGISFGMICGLIYTSLWCGWTVKGAAQVDGLQPRYFIPAALLLYVACSNPCIRVNLNQKKTHMMLYSGMCLIGWVALLTIRINAYI